MIQNQVDVKIGPLVMNGAFPKWVFINVDELKSPSILLGLNNILKWDVGLGVKVNLFKKQNFVATIINVYLRTAPSH